MCTPVLYGAGVILVLMVLDIITGFLNAVSQGSVSSGVMRTGLYKKFGSIVICSLAVGIEFGGLYIGVPTEICASVVALMFGTIGLMELVSVIENACALNPDLPMSKILAAFGVEGEHE